MPAVMREEEQSATDSSNLREINKYVFRQDRQELEKSNTNLGSVVDMEKPDNMAPGKEQRGVRLMVHFSRPSHG